MDDDARTADYVREVGSLAVRVLDAGLGTHLMTHLMTLISDVVVPAADHAATEVAAVAA